MSYLTDERRMIQQTARDFAMNEVLPIANKLKRVGDLEAHHMQLVMEGVLAVQAGANPRVIEQKLLSYLPAAERPETSEKAA